MQDDDTAMAILDSVAEALSQRGFVIIRHGEARQKIVAVSREEIRGYLEKKMPGTKVIDK